MAMWVTVRFRSWQRKNATAVLVVQPLSHVRLFATRMDCSTPGFSVLHHLLELAQTHVHRVSDAIQSSHPLSSPSPPVLIFPSIMGFPNESPLRIRWPKYWSFSFSIIPSNEYSGLISIKIYWFDLLAVQGTIIFADIWNEVAGETLKY